MRPIIHFIMGFFSGVLIIFHNLQDSKLRILKFSYSWAEEVEREVRMEIRLQKDVPVSLL
jgi:hypothetical protein